MRLMLETNCKDPTVWFKIGCLVYLNWTGFIMGRSFKNKFFSTGKIQMRQIWSQLDKQTSVVHRLLLPSMRSDWHGTPILMMTIKMTRVTNKEPSGLILCGAQITITHMCANFEQTQNYWHLWCGKIEFTKVVTKRGLFWKSVILDFWCRKGHLKSGMRLQFLDC